MVVVDQLRVIVHFVLRMHQRMRAVNVFVTLAIVVTHARHMLAP